MNRLTKRNENGTAVLNIKCPDGCEYVTCSIEEGYQCQHQCERDIIEKLAEYEDLEEQGLLLRLPCKVGDTAWYIDDDDDNYPIEIVITGIEIKENYILYYAEEKKDYGTLGFDSDDFGKTIFLTKAEAEQKLKEMESELYDNA